MASSKGKGQFSSDIENKWKREKPDLPNSGPDQSQAFGNDRGLQTRADSSPRKVHWFPSHAGQGTSGESALIFYPDDFLPSVQNCSPKISPTSTTGVHTHWLLCLKYPHCHVSSNTEPERGNYYMPSVLSYNIRLHPSHHFFVSQTLLTKAVLPEVPQSFTHTSENLAQSLQGLGGLLKAFLLL